jgi:hypothetical protein
MSRFPFWLVQPRTVAQAAAAVPVERAAGTSPLPSTAAATGEVDTLADRVPLLFTTAERMVAFMQASGGRRWEVRYITRDSGLQLLGDLHDSGFAAVHVDPQPDGSGGHEIALAELVLLLKRNSG